MEALKRKWRQEATEFLIPLKSRIDQEKKTGLLTAKEIAPFETAYQSMAAEIEEADLIKLAQLPGSISDRVMAQIARLEELIKSKDDGGGGGGKRIKKIKLFPSPRRIRTLAEWDGLKKDIEAQINAALDQGKEVELS